MTVTLQNDLEKKSGLILVKIQRLGIKRNCRDYYEYIRAKWLIEDLASSHSEQDHLTRIVTKYIGI